MSAQTRHNSKVLRNAAINGNADLVNKALDAGAQINVSAENGFPLSMAAVMGHRDVCEILIDRGAKVDKKLNGTGMTSLHAATHRGRTEICEFLIGRGADINAQDDRGQTPLGAAANVSKIDVIHALINKGADKNLANYEGQTPLHVAARLDNLDSVQALISRGVDTSIVDNEGQTALGIAKGSSKDFLQSLEEQRSLEANTAPALAVYENNQTGSTDFREAAKQVAATGTLDKRDQDKLIDVLAERFEAFSRDELDECSTVQLSYLVDPQATLDALMKVGIDDYTIDKVEQWFNEYDGEEADDFETFLDGFVDLSSGLSGSYTHPRYVEDLDGAEVEDFRELIFQKSPMLQAAMEQRSLEANTAPAKARYVEDDWTPSDNWCSPELQKQINTAEEERIVPTRSRTMRL